MDLEIDFVLANVQNNKITDVDSLKDIFRNFLKTSQNSPKNKAFLATKLFDDQPSFIFYLENRSSSNDSLTKTVKKAICEFVSDFIKSQPEFVIPYLETVFVG